MSEWRNTTLGEFVSLQRGHDLTDPERRVGNVPVMGSAGQNGLHDTALAKGPGVVVGRSGASFGQVHFSEQDYWPHNTCLYVTDFHGNDPRFAYYFLSNINFAGYNSGSAQPSLNRNFIYPIEIRFPDPDTQREIARVLGTLDDKIELNRRMNETLEAMARAIFQSWFVDFDPVRAKASGESADSICQRLGLNPELLALFPDSFEDSELGEIPKGWVVNQIGQFGDVVCGKTPPKINPEYFGAGIPFIKIPDMHGSVYVVNPSERLTKLGATSQAKKTIPAGSICVSCIATVGKVVITHQPSQTNQQINSIVPKFLQYTEYLYFQMLEKEKEFHDLASGGTATLNMNTSTFSKVGVLSPNPEILVKYHDFVVPLFGEVLLRQKQSAVLSQTRDTLLPKLLSGDLPVPSTEA